MPRRGGAGTQADWIAGRRLGGRVGVRGSVLIPRDFILPPFLLISTFRVFPTFLNVDTLTHPCLHAVPSGSQ